MTLSSATKLATAFHSWAQLVSAIKEGYVPTIFLNKDYNYQDKNGNLYRAAAAVRAALHKRGLPVYPPYKPGEAYGRRRIKHRRLLKKRRPSRRRK